MVSTVGKMNRVFNATSATANSFGTMHSTEVSRSNSQERILLQKRRMQQSPRALNIQLAYRPCTRRLSRPYHPMTHPRCDDVTESVKNVNRERIKTLENELQVTRQKLNEVSTENRTLKKMLRRQETTLKHYEGSETSLPHIMQAHDEDMRVVKALLKQEKRTVRELTRQLKGRDDELMPLKHEYHKLLKLARDERLGERRQLTEQAERQEEVIRDQDEKILTLTRRLALETKTNAHKLSVETGKTRTAQRQLSSALEENERLRRLAEEKQRFIVANAHRWAGRRGYTVAGDSQAGSVISLGGTSFPGLAAQLKPVPEHPWLNISLPEMESVSSTTSVRSKTALNGRPSDISVPNARQTVRQRFADNAFRRTLLELPNISSNNAGVETVVQSYGSGRSSDEEDDILSYESDSTTEMPERNNDPPKRDSLDEDTATALEVSQVDAGLSSGVYEMSITLIKNTSRGSSAGERRSSNSNGGNGVHEEKMTIVQLGDEETQVAVLDDAETQVAVMDNVDSNELSTKKQAESDEEESLMELEERLRLEKVRTVELKAKFDKFMEAENAAPEVVAPENRFSIDLEKKEKLLAALKAIDQGSPVKAFAKTQNEVKEDEHRQLSVFMGGRMPRPEASHGSRHDADFVPRHDTRRTSLGAVQDVTFVAIQDASIAARHETSLRSRHDTSFMPRHDSSLTSNNEVSFAPALEASFSPTGRNRLLSNSGLSPPPEHRSDLVSPFSLEPSTNGRPSLMTELFPRTEGVQNIRKPTRRGLNDFAVTRNTMFDQLGHLSLNDTNNNNNNNINNITVASDSF